MTICIAAACRDGDAPRIAMCADTKVSTSRASSETEFKLEILSPHYFVAMFAGPIPEARELLTIYRDHLPDLNQSNGDGLQESLRIPLQIRKRRMIEMLVHRRLGLSYEQFLAQPDRVDPTVRAQLFNDIAYLSIDVELLITGFVIGGPFCDSFIYKAEWEDVAYHRAFACIGAGAEGAEQALHRRGQSAEMPVERTLYNLYEAKKLSEVAPSVGRNTMLAVMEPQTKERSPKIRRLTPQGWKFLDDCYKKYGPRTVKKFSVPPGLQLMEEKAHGD